jgi:hypothetical protein
MPLVHTCACVQMSACPACNQSGSGTKKTNDAGTGPVPDQANEVQHFFSVRYQTEIMNADAGVSLLNADAQLCQ